MEPQTPDRGPSSESDARLDTGERLAKQGLPGEPVQPVQDGEPRPAQEEVATSRPVTEATAAAELRVVRDRLDLALCSSGAGTWDWDVVAGTMEWSPGMYALLGLDPQTSHAGFDAWNSVVHPDHREGASERSLAALADHVPLDNEYRIVRPDGEVRWISAFGAGVYDDKGEPLRMTGFCMDVTRRKEAETALAASEERHRSLFETLIQGVVAHEADGSIIAANRAAEQILGLALDQMQGRTSMDPRWQAVHEDGSDFPGDEHPAMVSLRTGREVRDVVMGVFNPESDAYRWIAVNAVPQVRQGEDRPYRVFAAFVDITERKQAEDALLAMQSMRDVAEAVAHVGSWTFDLVTQKATWSPEMYRLFGLTPGEDDNDLQMLLEERIHPDDRDAVEAATAECLATGRPVGVEYRVVLPDGSERVLHGEGTARFAADGTPAAIVGFYQDVTELRRLQAEAEQASEATLAAALHSMSDAVVICDAEGRLVLANEAFASYYRFASKAGVAATWAEYLEFLEGFMADGTPLPPEQWAVPRALRGETATGAEWVLRRKDTGESWIGSYNFAPIRDAQGEIVGAVVAARDITERMRAEEALRASEERFRLLAANTPDTMSVQDRDLRYEWVVNPALGLRPEDFIGKTDRDLVDADQYEAVRALKQQVMDSGEPEYLEVPLTDADGRTTVWDGAYIPRRDADGAVTGVFSYFRDVTEKRRAEEQLRERTVQLAVANKELEAFMYSAAHDLRAPLRAIDGFSQMIADDAGEKLAADDLEHLARVRAAAQRMAMLIDQLMALSQASRMDLLAKPVDASAIASSVLRELLAGQPERKVETVVTPGMRAIADEVLLRDIFANLIGNAWKFTSKHETARIEVGVTEADGEHVFFVSDDGAGFDMDRAAHLFAPFQRLHAPEEFAGDGIGLATVQRLVARHGGRVWAEAEVEKGATFFFTLPTPAATG